MKTQTGNWRVDVTIRDVRHGRCFIQMYFFEHCSDLEAQSQARLRFVEEYPREDEYKYIRCRCQPDDGVIIL